MATPFPGMDPYLERASLWANVHASLITALRDYLTPLLRPRYFVSVEERSYFDDPMGVGLLSVPDVGVVGPFTSASLHSQEGTMVATAPAAVEPIEIELKMTDRIRETYLEILDTEVEPYPYSDRPDGPATNVVTLIEILSPWNKSESGGRPKYMSKRSDVIHTKTNLVEIDLLRVGTRVLELEKQTYDYSIIISASRTRPRAYIFPFTAREPIPPFILPLTENDDEPTVDLNQILHDLYDRAGYDLRINYRAEPVPPFADPDTAKWIDTLLHEAGLR
ncbi:MAG: DUF4058 family protein [Chloroflexota bacterium]